MLEISTPTDLPYGLVRRMEKIPTSFGQKLKELRKARGLKQVEAADGIGISRSYLAGMESDKDVAGRETLRAIAKFYEVDVSFLLGDLPISLPGEREIAEHPDEIALLRFWRSLSPAEKEHIGRMASPWLPKRRR